MNDDLSLSIRALTHDGDLWVFEFRESKQLPRGDVHRIWTSTGQGPDGASHFAEWGCSGPLVVGRAAERRELTEASVQAAYLRGLRRNIDSIVKLPAASILYPSAASHYFDDPSPAAHPRDAVLWEVEHIAMLLPMYIGMFRKLAQSRGHDAFEWDVPTQWNTHGPLHSFGSEVKEFYDAYREATPRRSTKQEIPTTIARLQRTEALAIRAIRSLSPAPWTELRITPLQR